MITLYPCDSIADEKLKFAVIVSRYQGKLVFCQHKDRNTWEIPGGHREAGETILETARRELWEETGALVYDLAPLWVYGVGEEEKTYGLLCFAELRTLGPLGESEIAQVKLFDSLPESLTYPDIQPYLLEKVQEFLFAVTK